MLDIWSWISDLPNSAEWAESDSPHTFELASSGASYDSNPTRSIQLHAERTTGSNIDTLVTFSVCLHGFNNQYHPKKTIWVSDTCSLSSDKPYLPLLLQLLREIISRSPTAHDSTCPRSQLQTLKPDPFSWIMDSHSPESFSTFFDLVFVTRLFWLCACDSPTEVGSLYFKSLLAPNLEALLCKQAPALRTFLITVGLDAELCFMRTVGYMLAKWCILREVGVGLQTLTSSPSQNLGFSYATEACGFWVLKAYAPVMGMRTTRSVNLNQKNQFPALETRDSVLKYALAHQQLEAVVQVEYSVGFYDGFIQVTARVDNLRFHVVNLGFNKNDDVDYAEEKYFPSRVRVWVGPEVGANYVNGLSLGRSTDNGEREVKTQRITKGSFAKSKVPKVQSAARVSTRMRKRNWRWGAGNAVNMIRIIPTQAIEFATFECVKRAMTSTQEKWKQAESHKVQIGPVSLNLSISWISPVAVAGAAAGVVSTLVCHPLEVLKDRLTVSPEAYPSLSIAISKIYKEGGIGACYSGLSPTLIGMLPYSTCYYFMYEKMKKSYCQAKNKESLNRPEMLLVGALAGFTASTISFPLEVARKRLMVGALQGKCPPHMAAALSEVIREEGLLGLYRGWGASCLKVMPSSGITWMFYEAWKDILLVQRNSL